MKLFTKLWNDEDVGKHFPNNLPHRITFEEVRSLNIISNFHDEAKDSTVGWFPSDTVEQFEENKIARLDDLKKSGWINDEGRVYLFFFYLFFPKESKRECIKEGTQITQCGI